MYRLAAHSTFQSRFESEQSHRKKAQRQAAEYQEQVARLSNDCQELHGQIERIVAAGNLLYQEVLQLRPLAVWDGHPCAKCNKSMGGAVDREAATKVMRAFVHADCVKESSEFPLGRLLLACGAVAYGLSKLH